MNTEVIPRQSCLTGSKLVVRCRNLKVALGGRQILKGVDLELNLGELAVIFGRSASGKTTLLRCMTGFLEPDLGAVELFDARAFITELESRSALEAKYLQSRIWKNPDRRQPNGSLVYDIPALSAMMFADDGNLSPQLTAEENVLLALAPLFESRDARKQHSREILSLVGLGGALSQRPPELSSGQKRRLSLAQTIARLPSLIALDEPTAALDTRTKYEVLSLYQHIHEISNMTGVVVTHDIDTVLMLADIIFYFDDGRIVETQRVNIKKPRSASEFGSSEFVELREQLVDFLMNQDARRQ